MLSLVLIIAVVFAVAGASGVLRFAGCIAAGAVVSIAAVVLLAVLL